MPPTEETAAELEGMQTGPDRLTALWADLERLPPGLRNEIADFLRTVLDALSLVTQPK